MIEFKYIMGANIELFVQANRVDDDPEVKFVGGAEIVSVKLADGLDVETDDILIFAHGKVEKLDDLLEIEALEHSVQ